MMTDTELIEKQAEIIKTQADVIVDLRNENAQLKGVNEQEGESQEH